MPYPTELTKENLTAVQLDGNAIHFFYHGGAVVTVAFTTPRSANKAYYSNNWLYPARQSDDKIAYLQNVVDISRVYQK
jgi:hypothetical protein